MLRGAWHFPELACLEDKREQHMSMHPPLQFSGRKGLSSYIRYICISCDVILPKTYETGSNHFKGWGIVGAIGLSIQHIYTYPLTQSHMLHTNTHIYSYVHKLTHLHTSTYTHIHTHKYMPLIHIHTCTHTYTQVYTLIYIYISIYRSYMYILIHSHTHT